MISESECLSSLLCATYPTSNCTDFVLSYFFMIYEGWNIPQGVYNYDGITDYNDRTSPGYKIYLIAFVLQVCTCMW